MEGNMDDSEAANSVAKTIAKISKPLTEEQRIAMIGAMLHYLILIIEFNLMADIFSRSHLSISSPVRS